MSKQLSVKLSKVQAAVLKRLALGDTIINESGRYVWAGTIPSATVRALREHGLIKGDSQAYNASYTITEDGRKALEVSE